MRIVSGKSQRNTIDRLRARMDSATAWVSAWDKHETHCALKASRELEGYTLHHDGMTPKDRQSRWGRKLLRTSLDRARRNAALARRCRERWGEAFSDRQETRIQLARAGACLACLKEPATTSTDRCDYCHRYDFPVGRTLKKDLEVWNETNAANVGEVSAATDSQEQDECDTNTATAGEKPPATKAALEIV